VKKKEEEKEMEKWGALEKRRREVTELKKIRR
jgi:hypothetical protein